MQVYVSYLEIYNDAGYDLLDPAREIHGFEDLPRVTVFEDASSGVSLRNLSLHVAADEEAALNLVSCMFTHLMGYVHLLPAAKFDNTSQDCAASSGLQLDCCHDVRGCMLCVSLPNPRLGIPTAQKPFWRWQFNARASMSKPGHRRSELNSKCPAWHLCRIRL